MDNYNNNNRPQGRPAGQRPAGAPQGRPVGQRPAGAPQGRPAAQRPAGAPQGRPVGQRPAGAPAGQRSAGAPAGQRPAGTRPTGAPQGRPAGAPAGQGPAGTSQTRSTTAARPAGTKPAGTSAQGQKKGPSNNGGNNKKKKKKTIAIFVTEIVILAAVFAIFLFINKATDSRTGVQKYNLKEDEIQINEEVAQNESMKGYRTIALFGVDATTKTTSSNLLKGNRTDCIIIASINEDTGEVKLVSVYRDTYLNRSNDEYNKANSAYAKGGPEMAINMLNTNLDLNITDYITVGFGGLIQAIDGLGGIDINVAENEVGHLNSYQISISGRKTGEKNAIGDDVYTATPGVDYTPVEHAGLQTLNGLQATAYCRIRYVGNDFLRTQKQRDVLTLMVEKAKTVPATQLTSVATDVFPYISTSMDLDEITGLLANISKYTIVDNNGFPYEDYRGTKTLGKVGSCVLALDLETNVKWLHGFLYGDYTYEPSATVKENSAEAARKINSY